MNNSKYHKSYLENCNWVKFMETMIWEHILLSIKRLFHGFAAAKFSVVGVVSFVRRSGYFNRLKSDLTRGSYLKWNSFHFGEVNKSFVTSNSLGASNIFEDRTIVDPWNLPTFLLSTTFSKNEQVSAHAILLCTLTNNLPLYLAAKWQLFAIVPSKILS